MSEKKGLTKVEHRVLDEKINGINYRDHTYMVAGWLSDYKLTYDKDILSEINESEKKELTVNDFKENKGYVDDYGYVHIFREVPNDKELIPWFTIVMNSEGKPSLKFNQRRSEETRKAFHINRVGDLSYKNIVDNTKEGEVEYDAEVLNDIARATSTFIPEIKDTDDFLKKVIKTIILKKNVNVHKYKKQMKKSYILSNLIQGLTNKTKTSPIVFETWLEILGCDFEIRIFDNGSDSQDPLKEIISYNSATGKIIVGDKKDEELNHMARSARQYN